MAPRENANKTLCKICNIWIADNKPQREQHENGQKHKASKVRLIKEIAKKNDASRRAAGQPVLRNTAAQQMLEVVARATKVEAAGGVERPCEDRGVGEVPAKVHSEVHSEPLDENGYPLPVDQVYAWGRVQQEEGGRSDYMANHALGEFAPDVVEEETDPSDVVQEGKDDEGVARDGRGKGNASAAVAQSEDPEERKQLESAFKKRVAPKNRRKRRAR